MRKVLMIGAVILTLSALVACDLFNPDVPVIEVLVRPNPGDDVADLASESVVYFGKPANGVHVDVVITIRNSGSADLVLEADGPDYVTIIDQNEAQQPFSVLTGPSSGVITPGSEVSVTIRFTGQNTSTRYTAVLLIPSNDDLNADFRLNLEGDGETFS